MQRIEQNGLSGWSEKEGQVFLQAPVELLEQMLVVRIHLDSCEASSGPLRVVPGSHCFGRLSDARAAELRKSGSEVECLVAAGGALLMRPLLLHASSKATKPRHRRVLHFLYGPVSPAYGLQWKHAV